MAWNRMKIVLAAIPFLLLLSCGTDPRGYNDDTDYRWFRIVGIDADEDNTYNIFPVITNDLGCDNVADTDDAGEGDFWPNIFCGEGVTAYTPWDVYDIEVQNFARVPEEASGTGEPSYNLYVREIIIDAYDDAWQQHAFAPRLTMNWSGGSVLGPNSTDKMLGVPLTRGTFKEELLKALDAAGPAQGPLWTWHFMITVVAVDNYGHRYYAEGAFTVPYLNLMYTSGGG